MPLLSLVIPCYGSEKYIDENLDSVLLALSSSPIGCEAIYTVDPKEGDRTVEMLKKRIGEDPRFLISVNDAPLGPGGNRLKGVSLAKGEYVAFLDSDDLLEIDFFSTIGPILKEGKYDLVGYSNYYLKGNRKRKACLKPAYEGSSLGFLRKMFSDFGVRSFFWTKAIRKDLLLIDDMPVLSFMEDYVSLGIAIPKAEKCLLLKKALVTYRKGNENAVTSKAGKDRYPLSVLAFAALRYYYEEHGLDKELDIFLSKKNRHNLSLSYNRRISLRCGLDRQSLMEADALRKAALGKKPIKETYPSFVETYESLLTIGQLIK